LEIGGGESRLIALLKTDYEIWNLDKLEGAGFGPKNLGEISGFKLVKDYIGAFNPELPDNHFDLVFSISTIEHFPEDDSTVKNCIADIDRLLTHQGFSVHCVDALLHRDSLSVHPLVRKIPLENNSVIVNLDFDAISQDQNLWCLPPFAYYTRWFPLTNRRLKQFGRPFSLNILWQKQ
jgi:ubiquinone/menaquinone biosynthesis C-methylase UbiE